MEYKPEKCEHCGQSKTYILALDKGSAEIVYAIARAIGEKRINAIHPRKEIEGRYLTSNQVGNLSRPRFHGLIAKIKGNPGNYCLTKKGAAFLRNEPVQRFAIISKAEGKQIGYYVDHENEEKYVVRAKELLRGDEQYWEAVNYEILEGDIIKPMVKVEAMATLI